MTTPSALAVRRSFASTHSDMPDPDTIARVDAAHAKLQDAVESLKTVVFGQDELIELAVVCLIAGGNVSLQGPPGTAKTMLISQLANVLNIPGRRIQFTPDLMPSEITGSQVLNKKAAGDPNADELIFRKGPVFTGLLMADEINRASPKTQSALLQAMQEQEVTVDGENHPLSRNFRVAAAQNPYDGEGTSPLPQAQLDRFMFQLVVQNVDREAEKRIARSQTTNRPGKTAALYARVAAGDDIDVPETSEKIVLKPALAKHDLILFESLVRDLPISDQLYDAMVDLVRATRPEDETAPSFIKESLTQGSDGARAITTMGRTMQARALLRGAYAPDFSDLKAVAAPVLAHRIGVRRSKDAGQEREIVERLLQHVLDI